jgi:hypothetical protein
VKWSWFYWIAGGVLVAVFFVVLFVPGLGDTIEQRLLQWLARTSTQLGGG